MKKFYILFIISFLSFTNLFGSSYDTIIKTPNLAGMGNAGISLGEGINALYYNPAALAEVEYSEVSASYSFLFSDSLIRYNTLGYYFGDNGDGGIAIGLVSSGLNGSFSDYSDSFFRNYNENTILFGYGFNVYNGLSFGVKVKTFMVTTTASALGWGVDLGGLYNINNICKLNFLVKNVGLSEIKWTTGNIDVYNTEYDAGIMISPLPGINFGFDMYNINENTFCFNSGIEVWFVKRIAVRTGIYRNLNKDYVYTFGGSVVFNNLFFEYGIEIYNEISSTQTIGLDYKF